MILPALVSYYDRLANDPNSALAPFGYSRQKIVFCVVLEKDGQLHAIQAEGEQEGKRRIPKPLVVPGDAKPPGQGINPCFLWDNLGYMLGFKPDDPKPERTTEACSAFRQKHLDLEEEISDEQFSAVCRFLEKWKPKNAKDHEVISEIGTGFGVFRIRGAKGYVHERPKVRKWWDKQLCEEPTDGDDKAPRGQCLVTGEVGPIALLHEPAIKLDGGQQAGGKLVSFNCESFESYGKTKLQGLNSPVSKQAAFRYCTALEALLLKDNHRQVRLSDTTVVFWTESPAPIEEVCTGIMTEPEPEDADQRKKLHDLLSQIRSGRYPDELGPPRTPFYLLGLSPNAARISVRFWLPTTIQKFTENLGWHLRDFELERGPYDPEFPTAFQILRETVREYKDISPMLEGALLRAIWNGTAYPTSLYTSVLRRIRMDGRLSGLRIAAIKAYLQRQQRLIIKSPRYQELTMSLDPSRTEPAYHLGRLFALLERAQESAQPEINATIKDRFYSAASATPASVFPRLIRLNQHHLGKLEKGSKIYFEQLIQGVISPLTTFASHLNLEEQGLFAVGYYHQRQDLFKKKPKADAAESESTDSDSPTTNDQE